MTPRTLFTFAAKSLRNLLVLTPPWYFISPFYAGILAGVTNSILALMGYPPLLALRERDIVLNVVAQNIQVTTVTMSLYGVPVLLALVWAAPALSFPVRRRLSMLGLGAMALVHWLNLLSQAGMLLAPTGFWKIFSGQLFMLSALGDMLLPTLLCVSCVLRNHVKLQEARP